MSEAIKVLILKAQDYSKENFSTCLNIEAKAIENNLSAFYSEIECQYIDILKRRIKGKWYSVICDEEGLNQEDPIITALSASNQYDKIVGTVIITGVENENGDLASLADEDVNNISSRIKLVRLKIGENETISKVLIMD